MDGEKKLENREEENIKNEKYARKEKDSICRHGRQNIFSA